MAQAPFPTVETTALRRDIKEGGEEPRFVELPPPGSGWRWCLADTSASRSLTDEVPEAGKRLASDSAPLLAGAKLGTSSVPLHMVAVLLCCWRVSLFLLEFAKPKLRIFCAILSESSIGLEIALCGALDFRFRTRTGSLVVARAPPAADTSSSNDGTEGTTGAACAPAASSVVAAAGTGPLLWACGGVDSAVWW